MSLRGFNLLDTESHMSFVGRRLFLVRDRLYTHSCLVSVCLVSPVFRIVNETFTEASLAPVIDQLYSTNSWSGALQV
jgi:hypothetical protein